ncbi:MAG: hypothetical protein L3J75_00340 [Methylococcaceae bacterium]|nr:hypothetical protein [Methylococcaceae bacterium]
MWKRYIATSSSISLLALLLLTCLISGNASASGFTFNSGWPRFSMNEVNVQNSGTSAGAASALATANGITLSRSDTSFLTFKSTGKLKWNETSNSGTLVTKDHSAFMWAEIDTITNTVVSGRIDIFGDILGFNGLQFGADLTSTLLWKSDKIAFRQINHEGNVCNLGFCSFVEESLLIKDLSFNGDFSQSFSQNGRKAISTVPLPATAWLFMTGVLGLFGFNRKSA